MYNDLYDVFERFAIMTVEGVSRSEALKYIKENCSQELYVKLLKRLQEIG